jgi:hypothetical protein
MRVKIVRIADKGPASVTYKNLPSEAVLYYSTDFWTKSPAYLRERGYHPTYFDSLDDAMNAIWTYWWGDSQIWKCHVRGIIPVDKMPAMATRASGLRYIMDHTGHASGILTKPWPTGARMAERIRLVGFHPMGPIVKVSASMTVRSYLER